MAISTGFEFDVFLSHNSEDKPVVELIAHRLESEFGLNPFLDKWNLIPGKTWPNELERALDQSATTAVFLGIGGKGPLARSGNAAGSGQGRQDPRRVPHHIRRQSHRNSARRFH